MELTTIERAFVLGFLALTWAAVVMFIALAAVLIQQFFRGGR
ncbi:MAG: hypothetical protein BWY73_01620 [candidate division TA06 bacterium ADurb.Bin417]|uniref:Uncharacterized protein n=1 Tax=candidate division TA06 bacterium ADurb.Bin417 TaxID=1852828 RepID=A0A1V5M6A4_UNCT6|nr:MAG: hypothetical protein BWY73_01620 [candidate division TA06 bacterium ADurb.Bin417]